VEQNREDEIKRREKSRGRVEVTRDMRKKKVRE